MDVDDEEYYLDEYGSRRKKRPRTPPDMCGVCGATSTPEWRKGKHPRPTQTVPREYF